MGLHAAARLIARGHTVDRLLFLPVHDNYLVNKQAVRAAVVPPPALPEDAGEGSSEPREARVIARPSASLGATSTAPHFPMATRCELLSTLLEAELLHMPDTFREAVGIITVLPYEEEHAVRLLQSSPHYWGRLLPGGHLRTVPTAALIRALSVDKAIVTTGSRLGLVFGVDNLAGMAGWESPAQLLANADLILVGRGELDGGGEGEAGCHDSWDLRPQKLCQLLAAVRVVDSDEGVDVILPHDFNGSADEQSTASRSTVFVRLRTHGRCASGASSDGADKSEACNEHHHEAGTVLYALGAPSTSVRLLSSTAIREALATLTMHGYASAPMLFGQACCTVFEDHKIGIVRGPQDDIDGRANGQTPQLNVESAGSASAASLGGLLGGWVASDPKAWERAYHTALRRGEVAT